ncbi:MAG: glycosyltransferase, partial [Chloroflexota bacterium]
MSKPSLPPDVRDLLRLRTDARDRRDWAEADALRERLAALGWQVEDGQSGSTVRPILPPATAGEADTPASRLGEPATLATSIQVAAEDHPADLERFARGLAAHPPPDAWELVVVANSPSFDVDALLGASGLPLDPVLLRAEPRLGWADARTLGLRRSSGEITVLMDTSVEPVGDFVTPLLAAFEDPSVGIAGAWGVRSSDGRTFEEAPPGDVDAIEGYCLAIRRAALQAV